jgi:hypothetical protein
MERSQCRRTTTPESRVTRRRHGPVVRSTTSGCPFPAAPNYEIGDATAVASSLESVTSDAVRFFSSR